MSNGLRDPCGCIRCHVVGLVVETVKFPEYKRRRHCCPKCHTRWTTYESVLAPPSARPRQGTIRTRFRVR